jgi:hypothetical protein
MFTLRLRYVFRDDWSIDRPMTTGSPVRTRCPKGSVLNGWRGRLKNPSRPLRTDAKNLGESEAVTRFGFRSFEDCAAVQDRAWTFGESLVSAAQGVRFAS